MVNGLENVIVSLYAKGMSISDIEEQIKEVYNFEVSTSTISRITETVASDKYSYYQYRTAFLTEECYIPLSQNWTQSPFKTFTIIAMLADLL